jgi:hypothetical protein
MNAQRHKLESSGNKRTSLLKNSISRLQTLVRSAKI